MNTQQAKQILKHVTARTANYRVREALHAATGVVVTPEVAAEFIRLARAGGNVYVLVKHVHVAKAGVGRVSVHNTAFGWSGATVWHEGEYAPTKHGYYSMLKESLERGYHYYNARGAVCFPQRPRKVSRRLFYAAALEAWDASGSGAFVVVAPAIWVWEGLPIRFDVMRVEASGAVAVWQDVAPFYAEEMLRRAQPDARKWYTPQIGGTRRVRKLDAGEMLRADDYAVERDFFTPEAADGATPLMFALRVEAEDGRGRVVGYTTSPAIAARFLRYAWADARRWELVKTV